MEAREQLLAALAALGIALHLALRAGGAVGLPRDWPLFAVLLLGGLPMMLRVLRRLLAREGGADLLAGLSILASAAMAQYLVAAILVLMLSGGAALERFAARRASSVLDALARRSPLMAHRRRAPQLEDIAVGQVEVEDVLVVLPHELCPVDGVVLEGRGTMDESYLTGEPYELSKTPGSSVLSGAVNGESALTIVARKLARDSRYARIMDVMRQTELARPRLRRLGDQLAAAYVPVAIAVACGAWLLSGDPVRFLSVLVIATPCPLIIAIPVAVIGAISLAAGRGVVIKDPTVLERITSCRTVILDKTGTLTFGKPALTEIVSLAGQRADETLRLAASLERYSRHPLAAAVLAEASRKRLDLLPVTQAVERPGEGLTGVVAGRRVRIGSTKSLRAAIGAAASGLECAVAVDDVPAAVLRFRDTARPDSAPFLRHLSPAHGVSKIMLVSGDRASEVKDLASRVGISSVFAEKAPEEKVAIVKAETLLAPTLFVGDGINDAPALAAATVGVAMGHGSDITSAAAGAVIMAPSVGKLDELIHISSRMRTIALESALGGMSLSILGMGLAAAGLLSPIQGAVAQELIDLAAILNAGRVAFLPGKLRDY